MGNYMQMSIQIFIFLFVINRRRKKGVSQ